VKIVFLVTNGAELQAGVEVILFVLMLLYIVFPFSNFCFVMIIELLQYLELVDSYHDLSVFEDECLNFLSGGMFLFFYKSFGFLRTVRKVGNAGVVQAQAPVGAQSRCRCCLQLVF
jgi:hypothetical protein